MWNLIVLLITVATASVCAAPRILWTKSIGEGTVDYIAPGIDDLRVAIGHGVCSVDMSGSVQWRAKTDDFIHGLWLETDGTLFARAIKLFAFDRDGNERWKWLCFAGFW